jgi:hypothetical protein
MRPDTAHSGGRQQPHHEKYDVHAVVRVEAEYSFWSADLRPSGAAALTFSASPCAIDISARGFRFNVRPGRLVGASRARQPGSGP